MSILAERQKLELNKAVLQYLEPLIDNKETLDQISLILNVPVDSIKDDSIITNYLEKKWSTVLRLQKKILELETEVTTLKGIIESKPYTINTPNDTKKIDWLPQIVSNSVLTQSSQRITSVNIHPELPILFNGCSDGSLITWNLLSDNFHSGIPDKTIRAHTRSINRIDISPQPIDLRSITENHNANGSANLGTYLLATCSSDLSIKVWNLTNLQQVRTLTGHEHTVSSIAFSPSQNHILYSVSRDKSIKCWDLINGICLKTFIGHSDWVRDIDAIGLRKHDNETDHLGDFIVTCSNDLSIRLSHAESGTGLALLIGHNHVVERVKFLPMISNFILDKIIQENETSFPHIPKELITDPIYAKRLGYKYCISGGRDKILKLWLLPPPVLRSNRSPLPAAQNNSQGWHIADMIGHSSWIKAIHIHPNGKYIFSAGDDKLINIWDLSTLSSGRVQLIKTLSGHEGFINDVSFAPYARPNVTIENEEDYMATINETESKMRCIFISGGVDNAVKLWS